jgi:hypothetical protein
VLSSPNLVRMGGSALHMRMGDLEKYPRVDTL